MKKPKRRRRTDKPPVVTAVQTPPTVSATISAPPAPQQQSMAVGLCIRWVQTYRHHGTKILGFFGAALGTLELIDVNTVDLIAKQFGATWAHNIRIGLMILIGLGTAYRGYTNSHRQQQAQAT
jgi:hypothetical protein